MRKRYTLQEIVGLCVYKYSIKKLHLIMELFSQWRPQYHSQKTFVSFEFDIQLQYTMIDGSRWKTLE